MGQTVDGCYVILFMYVPQISLAQGALANPTKHVTHRIIAWHFQGQGLATRFYLIESSSWNFFFDGNGEAGSYRIPRGISCST